MQTEETSGENFMVEKTYFYRKLYGSDFVKSDSEKTIIPVRLKNQFISDSIFFDSEKMSGRKPLLSRKKATAYSLLNLWSFP